MPVRGVRHLDPTDRRILRLAIPALGALAVEPLYVLVDTAIVGRLGTDHLAGLAVAATVLSFVVAGSNFLTYGTTERVARRIGGGDHAAAADVGVQALWLAALVAVVVVPAVLLAAPTLVGVLGARDGVADIAVEYLRIRAIGLPFVVATLAVQGVLRGISDYRTPLVILLVSNVINVVIEVIAVFGLGWGIAGAAWSTVVAQAIAGVAFAVAAKPTIGLARRRRPHLAGMVPLASAGRHLLVRVGAMLAVFAGATAVAARIDPPTLAAHQVAMSLFLFLALTLDALAVPAQTLVAEDLGRTDPASARHVADRAVRLSIVTGLALGVALAAAAPWAPRVFTADPAVVHRATIALVVLALALVPAAVAFAHDGILIGAGDYRFLGIAAVGYLAAVTPFGVWLLRTGSGGIVGVWTVLAAWMLLRAVVNHRRTNVVLRRSIPIAGTRPAQA